MKSKNISQPRMPLRLASKPMHKLSNLQSDLQTGRLSVSEPSLPGRCGSHHELQAGRTLESTTTKAYCTLESGRLYTLEYVIPGCGVFYRVRPTQVWRTLEYATTKEECTLESKSCLESVAAPTPTLSVCIHSCYIAQRHFKHVRKSLDTSLMSTVTAVRHKADVIIGKSRSLYKSRS